MRKVSILLVIGIISCWISMISAQSTVIITENFDSNTVSLTSHPSNAWRINNSHYVSPPNCIQGIVPSMLGDSVVLQTPVYDFRGMTFVEMRFKHICKISPQDMVRIEYRISNGRWFPVPAADYVGSLTNYATQGFSAASYDDWQVDDSLAEPLPSWWKSEIFDLSPTVAGDLVDFRFTIKRGSTQGTQISYGWLLDDLEFITATYQVINPIVEFIAPLVKDTIYNVGPWTINAKVRTSTNVPINPPWLVYTATNSQKTVTDSILMTMVSGDSLWRATIPQHIAGTSIVYFIAGKDKNGNTTIDSSCFYVKRLCNTGKTITLQNGTSTYATPINAVNAHSYTQQIYLASEMGGAGIITSLAFDVAIPNADATHLVDIYMGHTKRSAIPNNKDSTVPYSDLTLVYSGTYTLTTTGWNLLTLQTPFFYNGIDNIVLAVDKNTGISYAGTNGGVEFYCEVKSPPMSGTYYYLYDINPMIPGASGVTFTASSGERPNVEFYFSEVDNNCSDTNSVALFSIDSPVAVTGGIYNPIVVTIHNKGIADLDSVTFYWTVNGQNLKSSQWTGKLPWDFKTQDTIGYFTGSIGTNDTLTVWVSMPNGKIDLVNKDDTLSVVYYGCTQQLSGPQYIGKDRPFSSIEDVFTLVKQCGVSGDITLVLDSGLYEENWEFAYTHEILNNYKLTITSANGNPKDVILRTSEDLAIRLYNVNNITIENITIDALKGAQGINLYRTCSNIVINNCIILADTSTDMQYNSNYTVYAGIYYENSLPNLDNLRITNCTIKGGYYGIYLYGQNSNFYKNIIIDSNIITHQRNYGLQISYININSISYNQIRSRSVYQNTQWYGLYLSRISNDRRGNIIGNRIYSNNSRISSTLYGIYASYIDSLLIANNEVRLNSSASTNAGLYVYYPIGVDCLHNSVLVTGTSSSRAAQLYTGTSYSATYKNNLFYAKGNTSAYAIYLSAAPATTYIIDYNNYYSSGTNLGYSGGARSDLAAWKTAVPMDANSVNELVSFKDSTKNLELSDYNKLSCPSSPIVPNDIEMVVRNVVTCIGAYDGFVYTLEAAISEIICTDTTIAYSQVVPVKIKLLNTGLQDNINKATFGWSINGEIQPSQPWTANNPLAPQGSIEVQIGYFTIDRTSQFDISVWIENVNGYKDSIPWNDTAKVSVMVSYAGSNLSIQSIEPLVDDGVLCLDDYLPLKVKVANTGALDYDFAVNPVTFSLRVTQPEPYSLDTVFSTGRIKSGEVVTLELTNMFSITMGQYDIEVYLNSPADIVKYDDTARMYYLSGKFFLPVDDDFSSSMADVFTVEGTNTSHKWGIIPRGMNADTVVVPQFGSGMLAFTGSTGSISVLSTKQLDLRRTMQPVLSFWYFHDTVYNDDYTDVRISVNGGATYTTLISLIKYNAIYGWKQYNVDLSAYMTNSCVLLVFEAMEKSRSGNVVQYIDRIRIVARQDIAVTDILPSEHVVCELGDRELQVVLSNLSDIVLDYTTTPTIVTLEIKETGQTFTDTLRSGILDRFTSDTITLAKNFNLTKGTYTFKAYFSTVLDVDRQNDTLETSININPEIAVNITPISGTNACLIAETDIFQTVTIKNTGNMNISDVVLILQIDTGETGSPYVALKETCIKTIYAGDSVVHTFNAYKIPWTADYYPRVFAYLSCDSALVNATTATTECVDIKDLSLVKIDYPSTTTDNISSFIQAGVTLKNRSNLDVFPNADVTVVVKNSQGVQTETFTETTGTIGLLATESYTFTQSYTVPNDSVYSLTVYINSYDNYPQNDTVTVTRYTRDTIVVPPGINSIEGTNVFTLSQNIPNPANNRTRIDYNVSEAGEVVFHVHSISGQLLYSQTIEASYGTNSIELNTSTFAAGIYFYSMKYKGQRLVRQLIINN